MQTKNIRGTRATWILILIGLLLYAVLSRTCSSEITSESRANKTRNNRVDQREKAFRHNTIYYTKHAKCRMKCRYIDQEEVKEILEDGIINYSKSEPNASRCPKYAVEGITHDKQKVRIIVGDCATQASIITVIDLENDFACDCPGDDN
jgi:Domain of unknown function (DUF4258)